MKVKRLVSLALALAVVLSTLCGCGKQDQPDVNDPNEGNKTKDTLIIGHWSDPPSLDPNNALNDCSMRVTTNVFDTLVRMDAHFTPQPCIAESWEISDNQMEYTFKIRNDVKFHNGDLLTVDDVVFSIDRGINSPKASPSFSHVKSVEKVDDSHVKIILNAPYSQILACLALPFGPIMSKSYVETVGDEQFAREPMGTGPYKFVNWVRGEKVVLEANEDYFLGAPAIKHVEWVTIADTSAALLNLESSDIDAYCDIQTSDYVLANANDNIKIVEGDALGYEFIEFNTAKAPFDNVKVRQAIAYAVDKDAMLLGVNDNIGTKIDSVVLEDALGYTDKIATYEYNLERRRLCWRRLVIPTVSLATSTRRAHCMLSMRRCFRNPLDRSALRQTSSRKNFLRTRPLLSVASLTSQSTAAVLPSWMYTSPAAM